MPDDPVPDNVLIRMYKMGTGDCFVLKFRVGDEVVFKMMIDCGVWSRTYDEIREYVEVLLEDVENEVDVLVVTHEHKDHVYGFQAAEALFTDPKKFRAKQIWLGWTEDDNDAQVRKWKEKYGQKKRALALAAGRLAVRTGSKDYGKAFADSRNGEQMLKLKSDFSASLQEFANLHFDGDLDEPAAMGAKEYIGGMKGMEIVKNKIARDDIFYLKPGKILEGLPGLNGFKIHVLGPPLMHEQVKEEHGQEDESYEHNKELDETDLFVNALLDGEGGESGERPFDSSFEQGIKDNPDFWKTYERGETWRNIDDEWLFASGQLALRMNSLTNNLSVVLAIERIDSGKVLLFPGDAELGSWKSWHKIKWPDPEFKTEELLNRTVFYKVAHHFSHNGTARSAGLDHMTSKELSAMATLDYDSISDGWKTTMPNRAIVRDLLEKTKGRLMVMNEKGLFYDLRDDLPDSQRISLKSRILQERKSMSASEKKEFDDSFDGSNGKFLEFQVRLSGY